MSRTGKGGSMNTDRYVEASEQLAIELYVCDLAASRAFYEGWGFRVVRDEGNFAELRWDDALLMLEASVASMDALEPLPRLAGNIRVMVHDVDEYWAKAQRTGAVVIKAIADRYYGLRDFTIAGPDGVGLRFATSLQPLAEPHSHE